MFVILLFSELIGPIFKKKKFGIWIMTQSFEFADMDLRQSASELSNSKCETTIREDFCRVILRAHWFNVRATYLWFIICISLWAYKTSWFLRVLASYMVSENNN